MTKAEVLADVAETLRLIQRGKVDSARYRLAMLLQLNGHRIPDPPKFDATYPKGYS